MKAVVLTAYGDADKLEIRDVPEPSAGPREIKVRVVSASINPVDYKLRSGAMKAFAPLELPAILGRDVAGEVVQVGPEVREFHIGDRVMGLVRQGHAEFVTGPVEAFAPVATGLLLKDAAALPLVGLTGAQLIEEAVNPRANDWVLVTGALGSVGRVAVYAARQRGANVVAGVRLSQKVEAEELDVEHVTGIDDAGDIDALATLDAIADTVGGETVQRLLRKIRSGGVLGSVLGEPKGVREQGLTVRAILTHPDSRRLRELGEAMAKRDLVIPISYRFPFAEVRAAHRAAEAHASGKILLEL